MFEFITVRILYLTFLLIVKSPPNHHVRRHFVEDVIENSIFSVESIVLVIDRQLILIRDTSRTFF